MSSKVLTQRLKDEMDKKNWTGRSLSTKANLSYNAIHYILSGKNKSTNFEVVNAIAEVLGVSPFYLLDENYDKNKSYHEQNNQITKGKLQQEETPYDGALYRQIMSVVEELLNSKNILTTEKLEYFTHYIYLQVAKIESEDNEEKNIRSYAEGIIDYAINTRKADWL